MGRVVSRRVAFHSDSSQISAEQVKNVYDNMRSQSPTYAAATDTIEQNGGRILVYVPPGDTIHEAEYVPNGQTDPNKQYTGYIVIPEGSFDGEFYTVNGTDIPITLERILAHETYHAQEDHTDGNPNGHNATPTEEQDATDFEDQVRDEQKTNQNEPLEPHRGQHANATPSSTPDEINVDLPLTPTPEVPNALQGLANVLYFRFINPLAPVGDGFLRSHDPLVFDLDGDGQISLLSRENSNILFDYNNDGFASSSGWVAANDGMFVIDLNNDGLINSVEELFGSPHPLSFVTQSFIKNLGADNGFANLGVYDSNNNGLIDSNDEHWGEIKIWQDVNQDGISQSSELLTLDSVGISTIDIRNYSLLPTQGLNGGFVQNIEGNSVTHSGTVTMSDASQRHVYDVWLNSGSENIDVRDREIDYENFDFTLPTLRGYGLLDDLDKEAYFNATLHTELSNFAANRDFTTAFLDLESVKTEVEHLVLTWAGINSGADSFLDHGAYSQTKGYTFFNKILGTDPFIDGPWFNGSPFLPNSVDGIESIEKSWDDLISYYTAVLLFQTSGIGLFLDGLFYSTDSDSFGGDIALDFSTLNPLVTEISNSLNPFDVWSELTSFINVIKPLDTLTTAEVSWLDSAIQSSTSNAFDWQDILEIYSVNTIQELATTNGNGPYADETFHGTRGEDHIFASNGRYDDYSNDTLYGYDGDDTLTGGFGNDILIGGAGNDRLSGGYGNDTYVYDSGTDFIIEDANTGKTATDTIAFGTGISQSDVSIDYAFNGFRAAVAASQDYVIQVEGRGSIIVQNITGGFTPLYISQIIDQVTFEGETNPVSINDIAIRFWGTDDDDVINLRNWGDTHSGDVTVYAGAGNDTINGFSDSDHIFDLGTGNDTVGGGSGDDIYIVHTGIKTITDWGGSDTVILPDGVTAGDLEFHKVALDGYRYRDIEITAGDTTIYIPGAFDVDPATGNIAVETIQFSDNTTLSLASQQFEIIGTDGNDQFATTYYGAWANDVYVFGLGDDVIYDSGGSDTIRFADGVTLNDLTIERIDGAVPGAGWIGAHMMISDAYGNSLIVANAFDATNTTQNILTSNAVETLLFSDNTTVDVSTLTIGQGSGSPNTGNTDIGSSGNDTMNGTSLNDTLYGGAGNDTILGNAGNDRIYGESGNDSLSGGDGNDSYFYASGDGVDSIAESLNGGTDTLYFTDMTVDDLDIYTIYNDSYKSFRIDSRVDGGSNYITFSQISQDSVHSYIGGYLERIVLADGKVINLHNGLELYGKSSGDDMIGSVNGDTFYGREGDDTLRGGKGDDTYVFNLGDGADKVYELANQGFDTIHFGVGITPDMVLLTTKDYNTPDKYLTFEIIGTSDSVTVFTGSVYGSDLYTPTMSGGLYVEQVTFEDGTVWDLTNGYRVNGTSTNDFLYGSLSNDYINSGDGNDYIYDVEGDDHLFGGDGNDILSGGAGNDELNGGLGIDQLGGGVGDDTYVYDPQGSSSGTNQKTIFEGIDEGTDTIVLHDMSLVGTRLWIDYNSDLYIQNKFETSSNYIRVDGNPFNNGYATNGSDVVQRIEYIAFDNGDVWDLSQGLQLEGTLSDDNQTATKLYGSGYDDYIQGNDGNDFLFGEGGTDQLYGGNGDDTIDGGEGTDTLVGQSGNDTFVYKIGYGNDTISDFTRGDDKINLSGIMGIYELNDFNWQIAYGNTLITFNGSDTLTILSENNLSAWQESDFIFAAVPDVVGTSGNDILVGTHYSETLQGLEGNDILEGTGGNDILDGGSGSDRFVFADDFGNDTILDFVSGVDRIDVSQLTSTVDFSDVTATQVGSDTVLSFTGISDTITLQNITATNVANADFIFAPVYGTSGNDWLYGTDGDDTIYGLGGSDHIYGYAGNDHLEGGTEQDWVEGGDGDDLVIGNAGDDIVSGQLGNDEIHGGTGLDYLWGNEGNDILYGEEDADALRGLEGDDTLYGGDGNDNLRGDDVDSDPNFTDAGNDWLDGGAGNDNLAGGAGDDVLFGGTGQDTMNGDAGSDTFLYDLASIDGSRDYIYGFQAGSGGDIIDISDVLQYNSLTDTLSDFVFLVQGSTYTRINIDIDGTGTTYGVQALAQLQNVTGLSLTSLVSNGNLLVEAA